MSSAKPTTTKARARATAAPAADPIFVAIAEHKAALAYWLALPYDAAHEAIKSEACGRETDAVRAVFEVPVTSPAGAAALLSWLAEPEFGKDEYNSRPRLLVIGDLVDEVHEAAVKQLRVIAALLASAGEG